MIYLNGQIGAVYMGGYYHSEVYLGGVLVWSGVKKIPGEAHAQLAFENTADGVAVVLLPGNVVGTLSLGAAALGIATQVIAPEATAVVRAETDAAAEEGTASDGAAQQALELYTGADGDAIISEHSAAGQDVTLHTPRPSGEDIFVENSNSGQLLDLLTPHPPADAVFYKDDISGQALGLHTPRPPGDDVFVKNGEPIEIDVALNTPSVPAEGVIVEKDHLTLGLQIDTDHPTGDVVNAADAASTAQIKVFSAPTAPGDCAGVEGTVEAQTKMSASAAPGDAAGISATGQSGLNVSAEGIGSTATPTEAQIIEQLKAKAQVEPGVLGVMAATTDEKAAFASKVVGKAVGWIDPVQSEKLLYVRQVYSAAVKQDGVLGNILEVT